MKAKLWLSAMAVSAAMCGSTMAQVTGEVKLEGKAPEPREIEAVKAVKECAAQHTDPLLEEKIVAGEKGELANVIVSIKKEEGMDLPGDAPKEAAVLDQKGCAYIPHVLPVMVGQQVTIKNSDGFMHNVHSYAKDNPAWAINQPNKDPGKKVDAMKTVETFTVKCDVHPWMLAYVRVFDHPFFAATGEDGKFTIKNAPDGEYTFVAWHESLGEQEAKGTVSGGKATVNFTFKSPSAEAPANSPAAEVKLAADVKNAECGPASCCVKAPAAGQLATPDVKKTDSSAVQAKAN